MFGRVMLVRRRAAFAVAVAIMTVSGCGATATAGNHTPKPSQTASANPLLVLKNKAEVACSAAVPPSQLFPSGMCGGFEPVPAGTMLTNQRDMIVNNADTAEMEALVTAYSQALVARGWEQTKKVIGGGDDTRWFTFATPPQCLEVAGSAFTRPGVLLVDFSVVYDYLLASVSCPQV